MLKINDTPIFTFSGGVTLEDYIDFNVYSNTASPRAKKLFGRRCFLYMALLALAIFGAGSHYASDGMNAFRTSATFVIYLYVGLYAAVMLVLLSPPLLRRRAKRVAIKRAKKTNGAYPNAAVLSFYENQMYDQSDGTEMIIQYGKIHKCHIDSNAIYLYTTDVTAFILPMRLLGDKETAFIAFLREKLPAGCFE